MGKYPHHWQSTAGKLSKQYSSLSAQYKQQLLQLYLLGVYSLLMTNIAVFLCNCEFHSAFLRVAQKKRYIDRCSMFCWVAGEGRGGKCQFVNFALYINWISSFSTQHQNIFHLPHNINVSHCSQNTKLLLFLQTILTFSGRKPMPPFRLTQMPVHQE